jgi:hypothetical protein
LGIMSRARCSAQRCVAEPALIARQIVGPGSAAHHFAVHRVQASTVNDADAR